MNTQANTPITKSSTAPEPSPDSAQSEARLKELAERLKFVEGSNKDLSQFLAESWRQLVMALVVAMALMWVVDLYRSAIQKKHAKSSEEFQSIQESFQALISKSSTPASPEAKAEEDKAMSELESRVQNLSAQATKHFYAQAAKLYAARAKVEKKDYVAAKEALATAFGVTGPIGIADKLTPDRFLTEQATLLLGRVLLEENNDTEAKRVLESLIHEGRITSAPALISLARVAVSAVDRSTIDKLAKELAQRDATAAKLIGTELKQLGFEAPLE